MFLTFHKDMPDGCSCEGKGTETKEAPRKKNACQNSREVHQANTQSIFILSISFCAFIRLSCHLDVSVLAETFTSLNLFQINNSFIFRLSYASSYSVSTPPFSVVLALETFFGKFRLTISMRNVECANRPSSIYWVGYYFYDWRRLEKSIETH